MWTAEGTVDVLGGFLAPIWMVQDPTIMIYAAFCIGRQCSYPLPEFTSEAIQLQGVLHVCFWNCVKCFGEAPQWGAADAEIKVPSGKNTELKRSPFKALRRSIHSHTCYAYCQGFLPCLFLHFRPFTCIFSKTSPDFFLCWFWLTHGSCVGPQNKIGHPAWCRFPCWMPEEYKQAQKTTTKHDLWYDELWNE